jgi:hypothetical protein
LHGRWQAKHSKAHTVHDQLSRVAAGRRQGGSVGTEPIRPTTAAPGPSVFVRAAL